MTRTIDMDQVDISRLDPKLVSLVEKNIGRRYRGQGKNAHMSAFLNVLAKTPGRQPGFLVTVRYRDRNEQHSAFVGNAAALSILNKEVEPGVLECHMVDYCEDLLAACKRDGGQVRVKPLDQR